MGGILFHRIDCLHQLTAYFAIKQAGKQDGLVKGWFHQHRFAFHITVLLDVMNDLLHKCDLLCIQRFVVDELGKCLHGSSYSLVDGKVAKNAEVDFSENGMITTISESGLLGFKSTDGKTVIKEQYQVEGTSNFTKYGLAVVSLNNLKGVIDKTGKEIIPCKYKSIYIFSDKVFAISEDNNQTYYLIDNNDKKIYDSVSYDGVSDFVVAYSGDKCGIVDRNGKTVTGLDNLNCKVYNDTYLVNEKENSWLIGRS